MITYKKFSGEIPRSPPHLLPVGAAQQAVNGVFSHGELRSLKGLGPHFNAAVSPVRGIFTDDGLRFFCWDKPTRAFLAPTIDDTLRRVIYQTHGQGIRVAQTDTMKLSNMLPGPPSESWKAGVNPPTAAPVVTVEPAQYWAGDSGARVFVDALCKVGAATVKVTPISDSNISEVTRWQSYYVTVPLNTCSAASGSGGAISPGGDGYITLPEACVTHSPLVSGFSGSEQSDPYTYGGAEPWATGALKINQLGQVQETIGQPLPRTWTPNAIDFRGKLWMPASTLFAALRDGTASPAAGTAGDTAQTVAFQVSIRNPDSGVVYLSQEVSGVQGAGGIAGTQYLVSIDPTTNEETETVAYVAVAINIWGEESAPSPPALVEKTPGQQIRVEATHTVDPGQVPLHGLIFYRTYQSNQSSDYYLLSPDPVSAVGGKFTVIDTTTQINNTTVLQSQEWDPPPDGAGNLTYAGNGFFCASSGKDLVVTEPYRPHAWAYRMTFPHGIVGVIAVEGGVLVTTQAQSYLVAGAHPSKLTQTLFPTTQTGWSDTAMARVESSAVFAGNDGLVDVFGGQPSIVSSQALFTRNDWRERYGAARLNMRLSSHDGFILGIVDPSYPLTMPGRAFLIRLDESEGSLCSVDVGRPIYCAVRSGTTDALYVGTDNGFAEFDAGGALEAIWHSGDIMLSQPRTFSAMAVDCDGAFVIEVLRAGEVVHAQSVSGYTTFRLPRLHAERVWSIRASGAGVLREISMAHSLAQLKAV